MKIFGSDPNLSNAKVDEVRRQGQEAQKTAKAAPKPETAGSAKTVETVSVSGMAQEAAKVSKQVRVAPETRKEKVEALKDQIDRGEYQVSGEKVAGKIIEDIIKQGSVR
ncbi:hypothetical protein MNBD_NITROSPINAE01-1090 [hydrothermal vent metagenome]|uniref:Negative regulator of flagellin synthesis n=1 Tax=hydrothermal vent metagenome TaxID=652676 RepID=A0A3B1BQ29_9ZZZZ